MGGADADAEERLAAYGENVGMAFQIFDDILDLAGAPAATGKRRGTDLCDGTVTLPVILAMQIEPALRAEIAAAAQGPGLEDLCDRLAGHEGLRIARERALAFVAAARRAIEDGPPDAGRRPGAAPDRRRRGGPLLVSDGGDSVGDAPVGRERIEELLRAADPLAAARAAGVTPGGPVAVARGGAAEDRLADGDAEGPIEAHRAAHAAGRPSEAAVAYGAGHDPAAVAARIVDLAALARETGLLRAVCPVPAEGSAERPGLVGRRGPDRRAGVPPGSAGGRRGAAPLASGSARPRARSRWRSARPSGVVPDDDRSDTGRLAAGVGARVRPA